MPQKPKVSPYYKPILDPAADIKQLRLACEDIEKALGLCARWMRPGTEEMTQLRSFQQKLEKARFALNAMEVGELSFKVPNLCVAIWQKEINP